MVGPIKELTSAELAEILDSQDEVLRLIDVRSEAELAYGTLPRAEHLPLHLIPMRVEELSGATRLVLYCRSGERAQQACQFLSQRGYDNVYNLSGGILSWARNGHPVVTQR